MEVVIFITTEDGEKNFSLSLYPLVKQFLSNNLPPNGIIKRIFFHSKRKYKVKLVTLVSFLAIFSEDRTIIIT